MLRKAMLFVYDKLFEACDINGFRMTRTAAAAARTSDVSGLPHLTHLAPYEGSHYRDCRRGNGKGRRGRKEGTVIFAQAVKNE